MPLQDSGRDCGREAGIGGEGGLDVGREFRADVVRAQSPDGRDIVAGLESQPGRRVDSPDSVTLETPKGLLGMVRLPWRAEFPEQGGQVRFRLPECDLLLARLPPSEGVEDEQRLVRGTLVALL